jgi:Zn-dependent protease
METLTPAFLALGLIRYIVFLFSTTCHEASHALAAKMGGDLTAFHGGQVSLNPVPHIRREPFGMVAMPLIGLLLGGAVIGWASAPYDPEWRHRHPKRAAWMSLAGPAANFALVLLAALLIHAGLAAGTFQPPDRLTPLNLVEASAGGWLAGAAQVLSVVFSLNILLGCFNLLPVPPLDGFSAIGVALPEPAIRAWDRFGDTIRPYSFLFLILGWRLFSEIYWPIFQTGVRLLYPGLYYR